eukprot:4095824-Amphidinium_carterae.2
MCTIEEEDRQASLQDLSLFMQMCVLQPTLKVRPTMLGSPRLQTVPLGIQTALGEERFVLWLAGPME